jgi:hypothetical protein
LAAGRTTGVAGNATIGDRNAFDNRITQDLGGARQALNETVPVRSSPGRRAP